MAKYNVSKMQKTVEEQRKALKEMEKKREEQLNAIYAIIGKKIVNELKIDCTSFTSKNEIIETAELILTSIDNDSIAELNNDNNSSNENAEQVQTSNQ